jgi:putative ABC transport system ATP-binding protein
MDILQACDLKKTYGTGEACVHALDGVSLNVEKGEFVAIVGTSGSGKSTLLHMLGGLDRPSSGKVFVDGKDIFSLKDEELTIFRRRKIGFVFQAYNLVPVLNVYENIVLPIELDGGKVDKEFVKKITETLGLDQRLDALPNQLSGGQQQRVAIARALAMNPEMLFFDEPTSALDPEITAGILKVLRQLADEKMTMIIVTHEIEFARKVADRVIFMDGGVIVEQGKPEDVIDNPSNERTKAFLQKMEK